MLYILGGTAKFNGIFNASTNETKNDGGVMFVTAEADVMISTTATMNSNKARYGGVMLVQSGSTVTLSNATMNSNEAAIAGGVFFLNGNVMFTTNNNTFRNNRAMSTMGAGVAYNNPGGALYFPSALPTLSGNTGGTHNNFFTYCYVAGITRANCQCPAGAGWKDTTCVLCSNGQVWNGSTCD